jgi:hypothetical protein
MMFDIRSNERYEFPDHKVEYTFGHFSEGETFEADLVNTSELGLCMLSSYRFTVGQEIILKNFMGSYSRSAVVIWVAEDEERANFEKSDQVFFKVGLRFSE